MSVVSNSTGGPDVLPYATDLRLSPVGRLYRYWRARILIVSMIGYALYYFVRTNISVPVKAMEAHLGYSKERLGTIMTVGGVTYGVSKFINGFLGDHANPRYFMAIGLFACAAMNICFGLSSSLYLLIGFWFLNSYAQGMGFPPCAKSMAYWFSPRERSSTFGIWHISHMIGAALISALTGLLVKHFGWRSCFYIPAGIAAFGGLIVIIFLRDTPESLGLPPVEVFTGEETPREVAHETLAGETYWQVVVRYILLNPYMWIISFANLVVYVLRYVQLNWGPTYLQEAKGLSVVVSGWLGFGSEIGGMVGALAAGFLTDRLFRGRAGRVCVIAMLLMAGAVFLFRAAPRGSILICGALFVLMGFLLYVPQMLIAAMAMNLGTKRASAAAVGLTGIIGYLSAIISGWGVGKEVDRAGWDRAFIVMIACALVTVVLMAFTWNVGAHPQVEKER